jgi:hypothetical protein
MAPVSSAWLALPHRQGVSATVGKKLTWAWESIRCFRFSVFAGRPPMGMTRLPFQRVTNSKRWFFQPRDPHGFGISGNQERASSKVGSWGER